MNAETLLVVALGLCCLMAVVSTEVGFSSAFGAFVMGSVLAETVEVHPLLVVAALIAGGAIGGLAGMLVAVPTAAFLKVQIDRWVDEREASLAEGDSGEEG